MKVLLDENLPHRLRTALPGHDVFTVVYMGWGGIKNGELLQAAEDGGFDVLLTADANVAYQQNLNGRRIAMVCLTALVWKLIQPSLDQIARAVDAASPGSFQAVECGRFRRGSEVRAVICSPAAI